jgi:hypothetical protein
LREQGIDPAPERGKHTSWSAFLKAYWECVAATDFFTAEVCTARGLVTFYDLRGRLIPSGARGSISEQRAVGDDSPLFSRRGLFYSGQPN